MQNRFDLLVSDVMPIYMIIPRYCHNYSLFYQLLDSNLFTHRNTYAILREATSETYGPRVYSHHINLHYFITCFVADPDVNLPLFLTPSSYQPLHRVANMNNRLLRLELALVFLEEERVMQHSSVSISLSF